MLLGRLGAHRVLFGRLGARRVRLGLVPVGLPLLQPAHLCFQALGLLWLVPSEQVRALVPAYKGTRTHDYGVLHLFRHGVKHLRTSFGVGGTCVALPLRGRKKLPPPAYTLLAHDALEADDIVHYVTRTHHDTCAHVTIVANDHDYLPLLVYPNVSVVKLPKCAPLALPKGIDTGDAYLTYKVLTGDKSDNLGKVFARLSKANAMRIANDSTGEALRTALDNANDDTHARWARNEQLIDNRLVPVALRTWLKENAAVCP